METKPIAAGLKIITVEDSALIVSRVREMLSDIVGVEFVGNAGNIPAALDLIKTEYPDVMILDINLGTHDGTNGIDLLNVVRKIYPAINVIMLTNLTDEHYRSLCAYNGAHYFFDKSNDFDKIPDALSQIMEKRKQTG